MSDFFFFSWLLSTPKMCTVTKAQSIHFAFPKSHIYTILNIYKLYNIEESILWSHETKSVVLDLNIQNGMASLGEEYSENWLPGPHSEVQWSWRSYIGIYECWRCGGSCALSVVSWIHTPLCDVIEKLETVDATLSSFHVLLIFQQDKDCIQCILPRWKSFSVESEQYT